MEIGQFLIEFYSLMGTIVAVLMVGGVSLGSMYLTAHVFDEYFPNTPVPVGVTIMFAVGFLITLPIMFIFFDFVIAVLYGYGVIFDF